MKKIIPDIILFGAVGAGVITTILLASPIRSEEALPKPGTISYTEDGRKVYHRYDCHPLLPELDEIEEIRRTKEEAQADIEKETEELASWDDEGWELGTASAYGGYGDADIANNKITATMEEVNENSYGVAVPMAWNTKENLGKTILIKYEGKVVEGKINDIGGMGNGTRSLDLQPGIFHEFGANDCNEWGLRLVEYKIIE